MHYEIRAAILADKPELEALIRRSARELSTGVYTSAQIEGALRGAFGVDTQLILDGTYFVAVSDGKLVGCGGWSKRRTLFGADTGALRDDRVLDPRIDAARIRAFFVDAACARQGIGAALLHCCESAATAHGYSRLELMSTLPGVPLYKACGYLGSAAVRFPLPADNVQGEEALTIEFVPMFKSLD